MVGNSSEEPDSAAPHPAGDANAERPNPPDAELLQRSGRGDGAAFGVLMERHADRLFRLAVLLVGNSTDAEDVLQESLAGAYRGAKKFQGRSTVKTWLTRIVLTQAALFQRQRQRRGLRQGDLETHVAGGSGVSGVDAKLDLHAALQQLSREHREVLVLRELEMLTYEQIAASLEVPVGTVESRIYRARLELKLILRDYGTRPSEQKP